MRKCIVSIVVLFLIGLISMSTGCGKKNAGSDIDVDDITYTKLSFEGSQTLLNTKECLRFGKGIKKGNQVILISQHVWLIDLETGKELKLFANGLGPDEIPYPAEGVLYDGNVYIVTFMPSQHIFYFSFDEAEKRELKYLKIKGDDSIMYNDLFFISKNIMVMGNGYWEKGYLRFYDLSKQQFLPPLPEKPYYTYMMGAMDINKVQICQYNGRLYVTESLVPEIKVVDANKRVLEKKIPLAPPFYVSHEKIPIPDKKPGSSMGFDKIKEWCAKWSTISDISISNGWILIHYRFGFKTDYCYELLNIDRPLKRYYFDLNPNYVVDFTVKGNKAEIYSVEELDESMAWKKIEFEL